jgi:hypothetical protein
VQSAIAAANKLHVALLAAVTNLFHFPFSILHFHFVACHFPFCHHAPISELMRQRIGRTNRGSTTSLGQIRSRLLLPAPCHAPICELVRL